MKQTPNQPSPSPPYPSAPPFALFKSLKWMSAWKVAPISEPEQLREIYLTDKGNFRWHLLSLIIFHILICKNILIKSCFFLKKPHHNLRYNSTPNCHFSKTRTSIFTSIAKWRRYLIENHDLLSPIICVSLAWSRWRFSFLRKWSWIFRVIISHALSYYSVCGLW